VGKGRTAILFTGKGKGGEENKERRKRKRWRREGDSLT